MVTRTNILARQNPSFQSLDTDTRLKRNGKYPFNSFIHSPHRRSTPRNSIQSIRANESHLNVVQEALFVKTLREEEEEVRSIRINLCESADIVFRPTTHRQFYRSRFRDSEIRFQLTPFLSPNLCVSRKPDSIPKHLRVFLKPTHLTDHFRRHFFLELINSLKVHSFLFALLFLLLFFQ